MRPIFLTFEELRKFAENFSLCSPNDHIFTVVVQTFKFLNNRLSHEIQNTESPDNTSSKNESETYKEPVAKIQFKESEPTIESTESLLPEEISQNLTSEGIEEESETDHNGQQEGMFGLPFEILQVFVLKFF